MADDSLMDLEFNEDWWSNGKSIKGYHYNIEKGEISWAYNFGPSLKNVYEVQLKGQKNSIYNGMDRDSSYIIDKKDTLWHYSQSELETNSRREERALLFYEPMLKKSIDELYEKLFK